MTRKSQTHALLPTVARASASGGGHVCAALSIQLRNARGKKVFHILISVLRAITFPPGQPQSLGNSNTENNQKEKRNVRAKHRKVLIDRGHKHGHHPSARRRRLNTRVACHPRRGSRRPAQYSVHVGRSHQLDRRTTTHPCQWRIERHAALGGCCRERPRFASEGRRNRRKTAGASIASQRSRFGSQKRRFERRDNRQERLFRRRRRPGDPARFQSLIKHAARGGAALRSERETIVFPPSTS